MGDGRRKKTFIHESVVMEVSFLVEMYFMERLLELNIFYGWAQFPLPSSPFLGLVPLGKLCCIDKLAAVSTKQAWRQLF